MPLALTINGADKVDFVLRGGTWSLSKRYSNETFSFTLRNWEWSALAYRAVVGDAVLVHHGTDLIFGGQIDEVLEYRAGGEGPIFVDVTCRGWDLLADQVILTGKTAVGNLLDIAYAFYVDYLQLKGVTWLGPTSGGPAIGAMTYTRTTLAELYTRMTKDSNWPWRINGDKELGFVQPGSLPIPVNPMYGTDFIRGVRLQQKYYEYGTRLILQTGGTGETTHSETHIADGLKAYFMLNVEPKPDEIDEAMVTTSYIPTSFKLNGVDTPIDSVTWFYDPVWHMIYTTAPVTAATTIEATYQISFPATVRVWEPSLLTSAGQVDIAFLVDKLITIGHITDVSEAKRWGETELLRRTATPRKLTGETTEKGFYPFLTGTIILPEHNVNASFLLENVSISDIGIDGNVTPNHLVYSLEFIEGDRAGRQWEELFIEMLGRGAGQGSIAVAGTGATVLPPTGGGSGSGTFEYPVGHVIHVGGDNIRPYPATTSYVDIPEMVGNFFGGPAFVGVWKFQAYGFQLSSGTLRIELYAGSQIALATTTQVSALLSGGFGAPTPVAVTIPGSLLPLLCRYSVSSGARDVVIGHCFLYRES